MPADQLTTAVATEMARAREDLAELVAFRSVADPTVESPDQCAAAAAWVKRAFADAGLVEMATAVTPDGSSCVYGHAPGPAGSPTVLLYSHYDVQPAGDTGAWASPPWQLTERDGRWYGRGAADCKGNVVMHLVALRALRQLDGGLPCTIKVVCEGSEEQGTGGLEDFVSANPDLLSADAILIADSGNFALGVPTLTTALRGMAIVDLRLSGLAGAMHSGVFGGAAPDALAGLLAVLATLRDEDGSTRVDGLASDQTWEGVEYPPEQFREDAGVLDGVRLLGGGDVAASLWARPAVTVTGIDAPSVDGAPNAIQATAAARVTLRLPPGVKARDAQDRLVEHLKSRTPWGLRCEVTRVAAGDPFEGSVDGPAFGTLRSALESAFGRGLTTMGQGGSIPLCNVLADIYPAAEIMLFGVEEPRCLIHAPDESVDPGEIERIALAEALFLMRYPAAQASLG